MGVEFTPLPHHGIRPLLAGVLLGCSLQPDVVLAEGLTVGQVPHDVEEPLTHTAWEILQLVLLTFLSKGDF